MGANQIHPLHNGTTTAFTPSPPLHSDIADNAGMPWKATDVMKERMNFVLEWDRRWNEAQGGPVDMAEPCPDLVVQARKLMPRRGPRKLRRLLVEQYPEIEWPSTCSRCWTRTLATCSAPSRCSIRPATMLKRSSTRP